MATSQSRLGRDPFLLPRMFLAMGVLGVLSILIALAAALGKLDDARRAPSEDKRTWSEAAAALDILPRDESIAGDGPFRTHPETEQRIRRLEQLTVEMEAGGS